MTFSHRLSPLFDFSSVALVGASDNSSMGVRPYRALQSLGYFFITGNLHAPASDYGLLGADFGVGAIIGALLVTFVGQRIGLARLLWIALVTSGLFVIVMSHLTNLYPALVAAFLFGVSTTAIIVTAGPLALHGTSREFVGRVMAVINPLGRLIGNQVRLDLWSWTRLARL